jgi:hypothetical protein
MGLLDSIRRRSRVPDVRDTLRLSMIEFELIPIEPTQHPPNNNVGDQWRVRRDRVTSVNGRDVWDCGWDYFTIIGFDDSDRTVIYSMRLEAWENNKRLR